jgi:hypothetical protein
MSVSDSTTPIPPGKPTKPNKPYPDFPLFPHATRRWAKKIRGKLHYFGPWSDPDGALAKYLEQKDALHAGRRPREATEGLAVKELANAFLNAKQALVDAGELSPRTWAEYKAMAAELVGHLGKARLVSDLDPDDFAALRNKLAKKWGPHRLKKAIQYIRSIFKHAYDAGLIDRPVRFGPGFKRPSMKTLRLHRARQGEKLFTARELRRILDEAGPQPRAMILLGVNCGYGNADVGTLPLTALDMDGGWVNFPRPKPGIARRCPLWPETVQAVKEALACRPEPKGEEHAGLVFVTKYGGRWAKDKDPGVITKESRGIAAHHLAEHLLKGSGHFRAQLPHGRGVAENPGRQPRDGVISREGGLSGQQVKETAAETVQVGPGVRGARVFRLLGGDVIHGAHEPAHAGQLPSLARLALEACPGRNRAP